MKATGIVVEYNPFHNGHLHHAKQAKKLTSADIVIAVMSGNFLQRGEPAFIDKWTRTKMALANEVDIVFELPYAFATANAQTFASGAIQLLDAAQCTAYCFGSEDGDIKPLERSLYLINQAGESYEQNIKEAIGRGISYPTALNIAYKTALYSDISNEPTADLSKPNNILGFHYMEAALQIESSMQAVTIPRIIAHYHDDIVIGNQIASATGIRKSFFELDKLDNIADFIPQRTSELLVKWQTEQHSFGSWHTFYPQLRFIILREGPIRLKEIADITEGIENLLYRAAKTCDTFESFMQTVKSKRYTWTRIQRMLTHILTGFTYDKRKDIKVPTYLRLLGMTQAGKMYLNHNKKRLKLPLVSKAAAFKDPSLEMDIGASDLYALGIGTITEHSIFGSDYTNPPIIV